MALSESIHFSRLFFLFQTLSLVIELLAASQSQLDLGPSLLKVDLQRNQGEASFLRLAENSLDFVAMQKQLSNPFGLVIVVGSMRVGTDMQSIEIDLSFFDSGVAIFEIGPAFPQGLHFGPKKHHTGLQGLHDLIIMIGLLVLADQAGTLICVFLLSHGTLRRPPLKLLPSKLFLSSSNVRGTFGNQISRVEDPKFLRKVFQHDVLQHFVDFVRRPVFQYLFHKPSPIL